MEKKGQPPPTPSSIMQLWEQLKARREQGKVREQVTSMHLSITSLASSRKHSVYFCKVISLQIRLESMNCMWALEKEQSRTIWER